MAKLSRAAYANICGPTRGDLVRLADTSLLAEMEAASKHTRTSSRRSIAIMRSPAPPRP